MGKDHGYDLRRDRGIAVSRIKCTVHGNRISQAPPEARMALHCLPEKIHGREQHLRRVDALRTKRRFHGRRSKRDRGRIMRASGHELESGVRAYVGIRCAGRRKKYRTRRLCTSVIDSTEAPGSRCSRSSNRVQREHLRCRERELWLHSAMAGPAARFSGLATSRRVYGIHQPRLVQTREAL